MNTLHASFAAAYEYYYGLYYFTGTGSFVLSRHG